MPGGSGPPKRYVILLVTISAILAIIFVSSFHSQPLGVGHADTQKASLAAQHLEVSQETLAGDIVMPKLANETAKAELGRATWKYFHSVMARFPDKPTEDESTALRSYIQLFTRLYPCGECAQHFSKIIQQYPPQVSSRSATAAWACHVHNEVNKSLKKDIFDCSNIGDFYDCGCAEDEKDSASAAGGEIRSPSVEKPEMSQESKERLTGEVGRDFNVGLLTGDAPLRAG